MILLLQVQLFFSNFEEIPSNPQLCFVDRLCTLFFTVSSSTFLIKKLSLFAYLDNNYNLWYLHT